MRLFSVQSQASKTTIPSLAPSLLALVVRMLICVMCLPRPRLPLLPGLAGIRARLLPAPGFLPPAPPSLHLRLRLLEALRRPLRCLALEEGWLPLRVAPGQRLRSPLHSSRGLCLRFLFPRSPSFPNQCTLGLRPGPPSAAALRGPQPAAETSFGGRGACRGPPSPPSGASCQALTPGQGHAIVYGEGA